MGKPNSTVWYVTSQLKQAKDILWRRLLQILGPSRALFEPKESELEIYFNNGSLFAIKHAKDIDCRRGPSLSGLGIDEAQDFSGDDFMEVFQPLTKALQAPAILAGTKKRGSWFLKEWLAVERGQVPQSQAFWFPSTTNPLIPQEEWDMTRLYLTNRNRMDIWENEYVCDPHKDIENDVTLKFMEFSRVKHVCAPFVFPPTFRHFFAEDWGMTDKHPMAALWGAVSQDGTIFIYDEYLVAGVDLKNAATAVLEQGKGRKIEAYVLDEACWKTESDGLSAAIRFSQAGLRPAARGRREDKSMTNASLVKAYLKPVQGPPKLQIFPNCVNLIECLETLRWQDKLGDDMGDALGYLLRFLSTMSFNPPAQALEPVFKRIEPKYTRTTESSGLRFNPDTGYFY